MRCIKVFSLFCVVIATSFANITNNPNFAPGRSVMVHLFEWKWDDIALECERFLGPNGYAGVQVSPVTENVIIKNRPWWERYQPVSFKLTTRSGNETQFADMVRRCNAAGVRIYVDVVINHMSATHETNVGTGGSIADPKNRRFPGVPFNETHFNSPVCTIEDWDDPIQMRNCELIGLRDLNLTHPYVREKTIEFLNHLIDIGVSGFRVDAAKHIWPSDLDFIYKNLKQMNTWNGFDDGSHAYIYQEVIDFGSQRIPRDEYLSLGPITEFRHSYELGRIFQNSEPMHWMRSWGTEWSFVKDEDALVFVDNHDNQRHERDQGKTVVFRDGKKYRMATAWMLAHPYGNVRIMSSYEFPTGENDMGPPHDKSDNILSPTIHKNGTCGNGWICEHRWPTTVNMVNFRIVAGKSPISMWYDNGNSQVAFSRANRTFIAFNNEENDFNTNVNTNLPMGDYCDIISGKRVNKQCTGSKVSVDNLGNAHIYLPANSTEGVIAIHVGPMSKLA